MNKLLFLKVSLSLTILLCLNSVAQIPGYIPLNGLQAWYPFSGNANDLGPGAYNGTVTGASLTTDRFNASNCAYNYNGVNNYVTVADNVAFRPQNFTISSWVTFSSTPNNYHLIIAKNAGSGSPESIDMNYAASYNGWFCNIGTPSLNGPFLISPYSVNVGAWYNLVYQFDDANDVQRIYINGVFTASSVVNTSVGYDTQPWTFGMEYEGGTPNFFFDGKIDDIGIWDRILSPEEILQVYNSITGIKIEVNDDFFSIYPNPANDHINIKITNSALDNSNYKITDVIGKTVLTGKLQSQNTSVSIEILSQGVYFLQVGEKQGKLTRIIKQ